uniref:trypsin n=1 Tax=Anopheles christyi TaxID=43041 RepID=A0A182K7T0_9DIPT
MYLQLRCFLSLLFIGISHLNAQRQYIVDKDNGANLIVGGFVVNIEQVPYQAAVFQNGNLVCGGSIIGPRWIITARHCVETLESSEYAVVVGTDNPLNGNKLKVENIITPTSIINGSLYDMALVKLLNKLVYNQAVQCIPLLKSMDELVLGKPAVISGFGATAEGGLETPLKAANVNLLSAKDCEKAYSWMDQEYMICAGFNQGLVDTCQGDSGGPLVVNSQLAGVVFYGEGCAKPNYPGIYVSIPWFYDWIVNVVRDEPNEEERELCNPAPQE